MESPHHGALDPGSHPRTATEASHSGASGHYNTIQMYTSLHVDMFSYVERTHMFFSLRVWECAKRVNADLDISCQASVRCLGDYWMFPLLQEYSLKSPNLFSQ